MFGRFANSLFSGNASAGDQNAMIPPSDLHEKLSAGEKMLVLDVRGPEEFHGPLGHIEGALSLPLQELAVRIAELEAHRDMPVVAVCHTDRRSSMAAVLLQQANFSNVRAMAGGMSVWQRQGLPVARRAS